MKKKISVILGSESDKKKLQDGLALLDEFGLNYQLTVLSAHRNPDKLRQMALNLEKDNVGVVIACAGLACALPGFVAAYSCVPVIGVPIKGGMLDGMDSLLSIVQVPKGLGLVSSGMGKRGFINALIFALEILSLADPEAKEKLEEVQGKFKK
jgi:5-(carboxyamino)imidazole ribonucleotide mutase